jgi:hypothetical protein
MDIAQTTYILDQIIYRKQISTTIDHRGQITFLNSSEKRRCRCCPDLSDCRLLPLGVVFDIIRESMSME